MEDAQEKSADAKQTFPKSTTWEIYSRKKESSKDSDKVEDTNDNSDVAKETKSRSNEQSKDCKMLLRVIIVGKSGDGKSSTGNTLLRQQLFKAENSAAAVTNHCQMATNDAIGFSIVDTPGLCDAKSSFAERALEVQKSLEICGQPHAFLLVFKMGRFTTDDSLVCECLPIIFGEQFFDHCIVVFTHGCQNCHREESNQNSTDEDFSRGSDESAEGDAQRCKDEELRLFWSRDNELSNLIKRCNYHVLRIENDEERQCYIHTTDIVTEQIRDEVYLVSNQGKKLYSYPYIKQHRTVLEEHMTKRYDSHIEAIKIMWTHMNKMLTEIQKKELFLKYCKYCLWGVAGVSSITAIWMKIYSAYRSGIVNTEEIEVIRKVIQAARQLSAPSKDDFLRIILKELSTVSKQSIEKIAKLALNNKATQHKEVLEKLQKLFSSGNIIGVAQWYLLLLCMQAIKI